MVSNELMAESLIETLQGKDLLAEVIVKVSSVTKLEKFVKKTSATTFFSIEMFLRIL
jgi:hypothetical protein